MDATDAELAVGRRLVAQTEETAVKTAEELKKQTGQMQTIAEDLNEIEFTMQRASKVLRDITRGLATDKCAPTPAARATCRCSSSMRSSLSRCLRCTVLHNVE